MKQCANPIPLRFRRRGIIFVAAIWIMVILGALVLVFARSMRTEVIASGNQLADAQTTAIELGAEQYVLSAVDGCGGDAAAVLQTPAEQMQLGSGYFWILQPYQQQDYQYAFGICDECSKLPLNSASDQALALLPGITQDLADSIVDWRDADETVTGQGAESSFYESQPRPYASKNALFESVEELYLIKNMSDDVMWGMDLNHNGVMDLTEQQAGGMAGAFNAANNASRGIAPYVTVWGTEPNTSSSGQARIDISNVNQGNQNALQAALKTGLNDAKRASQISGQAMNKTFKNIFDFAVKTNMKSAELAKVEDLLTTTPGKTRSGGVNVNTATEPVLMCLGLQQADADAIIAQQSIGSSGSGGSTTGAGASAGGAASGATPGMGVAWVMDAITPAKAVTIGSLITGKSYFYSADIVAVTGDGRAFRRIRIVVDASSSPPLIVYRKDLTSLGWPLSDDIRAALRAGQPPPASNGFGTGAGNGLLR